MAQRLAIARGLVHDPAIVLLDEPFTGLDRGAAEILARRVTALRDEGRTLLLVTHEIARVASLASAVFLLARGRIVHRAAGADLTFDALDAAWRHHVDGLA
jgi:ABC-type multidrug transport system ATPase subunit